MTRATEKPLGVTNMLSILMVMLPNVYICQNIPNYTR